jgi:hypothetical protein
MRRGSSCASKHTPASYGDLMRTTSPYRVLEPTKREALPGEIGDAITAEGGAFELPYETHLYRAGLAKA